MTFKYMNPHNKPDMYIAYLERENERLQQTLDLYKERYAELHHQNELQRLSIYNLTDQLETTKTLANSLYRRKQHER